MWNAVCAVLAAVALLGVASNAHAGVASIWAVNDGEKVDRGDLSNSNKSGNSAWDGKTIHVFGARNEIVAFQVIVESDGGGIKAVSAALGGLKRRGVEMTIDYAAPGGDPTDYRGRGIRLFSEHYMDVTKPTEAHWVFQPGSAAAPKNPTGWKPVQLVPENAKAGMGGFPLAVGPSQNQAFWIDVYIPRTAGAGIYDGKVAVAADGKTVDLPVELEVLDFSLPDRNSVQVMIYYESDQPILYEGRNLDDRYHRFAHENRVEFVNAYDEAEAAAAAGLFNGKAFTSDNAYEGPGEGVGYRIIPRTFYGPGSLFDTRERAWQNADSWMSFLARNFPQAITFVYMPDEPSPARFPYIKELAENIHSDEGPGGKLPVFVTKRIVPGLEGAIDIWCSDTDGYDIAAARAERDKGHEVWVYNGCRPAAGAIIIDSPATDPRATMWACFKESIPAYFFWHGVHWEHNSQKQGERRQNVWVDPITFDNTGQPNKTDHGYINGDGVICYPGTEKVHPDQDRGIEGPCSTIQLANFRRGIQDHLYLTLAREAGCREVVEGALGAVVPRVFSDAKDTVGFAEDGNTYEQWRYKVGKAIVEARKPK